MGVFDNSGVNMDELAKEIAQYLGTDNSDDIRAIKGWLLQGNDDGSCIADLAYLFGVQVGLPSRG